MDKLICVGKNYLDHAKEMGDAIPEKPVLFLKPESSVVQVKTQREISRVSLPKGRGEVHHECEILVRLGEKGQISAVSLGLDLTLRDLQADLKKKGHPWEISKVFSGSAILGPWIDLSDFPEYLETEFTFTLEGAVRQRAKGTQMRLSPVDCIQYAAEYFSLCPGDVLFTGTPAGVGPIAPGQIAEMSWGSKLSYRVQFQ